MVLSNENNFVTKTDNITTSSTIDDIFILDEANNRYTNELHPSLVYVGVLMVVGVVGNSLVCYVFGFRFKKTAQNLFIIFLAVFDMMSCAISLPGEIVDMSFHYKYNWAALCKIMRFINTFTSVSSIFTLIVIAIDRYRRVRKPLKSQIRSRHSIFSLIPICGMSTIFSIPSTFVYGLRTVDSGISGVTGLDCTISDEAKVTIVPLVYNGILFLCFFILAASLIVMYSLILRGLKQHALTLRKASVGTLSTGQENLVENCILNEDSPSIIADDVGSENKILDNAEAVNQVVDTAEAVNQVVDNAEAVNQIVDNAKAVNQVVDNAESVNQVEDNAESVNGGVNSVLSSDTTADSCHFEKAETSHREPVSVEAICIVHSEYQTDLLDEFDNSHVSSVLPTEENSIQDTDNIKNTSVNEHVIEKNNSSPTSHIGTHLTAEDENKDNNVNKNKCQTFAQEICTEQVAGSISRYSAHSGTFYREGYNKTASTCAPTTEKPNTDFNSISGNKDILDNDVAAASETDITHVLFDGSSSAKGNSETTVSEMFAASLSHSNGSLSETPLVNDRKMEMSQGSLNPGFKFQSSIKFEEDNLQNSVQDDRKQSISQKAGPKQRNITRKTTIITFVVTIVFIISFVPHLCLQVAHLIYKGFDEKLRGGELAVYNIFIRSYFLNSVANPIIYGVMNDKFRVEVKRLIMVCRCWR